MQLSGRPLLDTGPDAALFVDAHDAVPRLCSAADGGLNVLVSGSRGIGKTSLLRRVALQRRTSHTPGAAVVVSTGTASSPADVLALVHRALQREPTSTPKPEVRAAADLHDALARLATGPPALVLLDNLPPTLAHAVFGQLRDDLWQLPLSWVVTCADSEEAAFLRPPADAFFDIVLRLPPFDPAALRELVRRRVGDTDLADDALDSVVELARGNPRTALNLTRHLTRFDTSPVDLRADVARRAEVLARLGRPAEMLLAELDASGGASASDEAMLVRLGWTRARAAQVLDQLARAGLVEATDVRNGPGRPRRVYRPTGAFVG